MDTWKCLIYLGEVYDLVKTYITSCGFPRVCSNYGICTNGQCSCPRPINATSYFQPIEESKPKFFKHGCSLITPLSCEASKTHILLVLQNITYYPFTQDPPSINPDHQHINLDSCKQACLKDCSCKAAFYNSSKSLGIAIYSPKCFHWWLLIKIMLTLKYTLRSKMSKMSQVQILLDNQKKKKKNYKKNNQIIVGSSLSDLCFLCFF